MEAFRALYHGVAWGFTATYDFLQEIVDLTHRGIKRARGEDADITIVRTIADHQQPITPLAIEERSQLLDGSVKRRRLDGHDYDYSAHATNARRSPSPLNEQLYRARKTPAQVALTQHQIASTDFTAGITFNFDRQVKPQLPLSPFSARAAALATRRALSDSLKTQRFDTTVPGTSQYESKYDAITKPQRYEAAEAKRPSSSARYHPYERRQHSKAEPTNLQKSQTSESHKRHQSKKLRGSRSDINAQDARSGETKETKAAPDKADEDVTKYANLFEVNVAKSVTRFEENAAIAVKLFEEEAAERLRLRKAAEQASEAAKEEHRLKEENAAKLRAAEEAKLRAEEEAKRDARKNAVFRRRQQAAQHKADREAEEARAYAERTAMVEEEDEEPEETPRQKNYNRMLREAAAKRLSQLEKKYPERYPLKLWSPKDDEKMAALDKETGRNSVDNRDAQQVATPEQFSKRSDLHVRYKISPNSGLEAVDHKTYDRSAPPTELNTPDGPWPRKSAFFVRPFDYFLRNGFDEHPTSLPPSEPYGLELQYEEYPPVVEEAHDTSIEMTDASPPPAPAPAPAPVQAPGQAPVPVFQGPVMTHVSSTIQGLFQPPASIPTQGPLPAHMPTVPAAGQAPSIEAMPGPLDVEMTGSATPQVELITTTLQTVPSSSDDNATQVDSSSHATLNTPGSLDEPPNDPPWMKNLSTATWVKIRLIREARRVAAEAKKKAEEEAAARAKAEEEEAARVKAAEEARIAQEKAEAEAKAAEEERKKKGGRRMPSEKFVRPLSSDWETRLATEMSKGSEAQVTTTPAGVALKVHDFSTVLSPQRWLNDEIINAYLEQTVAEANENAGAQKYLTHNSFFYSNLSKGGPAKVKRWMSRKKFAGEKMLDLEAIFIPVNQNAHWTLIVVSPRARTIEYLDSFGSPPNRVANIIRGWLAMELGSKYVANEWTVPETVCARQRNGYDCGVFTITNAKCVALGFDPTCYDASDMALQRRRIAAEIINKGSIN